MTTTGKDNNFNIAINRIAGVIIMLLLSVIAYFLADTNQAIKESNKKIEENNKRHNELLLKVETYKLTQENKDNLTEVKIMELDNRVIVIENKLKIK
ncbi:MAG: hypothetical protein PHE56_08220 [Bacteroidales bacterium]|nr:hypothetical protein [Bacteroidales bacterium]